MIAASQAIRRTVSGASSSPVSVVPAPVRSMQVLVAHRHDHGGLRRWPGRHRRPRRPGGRPRPARPPGAGRWSGVSEPCSVEGCGAASGPRMASSTADPSGSSRSRYSAIPSSSYGLGQGGAVLEPVLAALELPEVPVLRDQRRAAAPGSPAAPAPRPAPRTPPAPSRGTPGSAAAAACPSPRSRRPRCGPAPAPPAPPRAAPGSAPGAIATVTCTRAAAPPAAYEWPQCRTHPAGDAASDSRTSPRRQALTQHRDLAGLGQQLQLVQLGEHRPQPVRPGLVQPAQQRAQPRETGGHRRPVRLEAGPLHDLNLAATTDKPPHANTVVHKRHRRTDGHGEGCRVRPERRRGASGGGGGRESNPPSRDPRLHRF